MRIFVEELVEGEVIVRGDEHHYLAHVRRARVGDMVELFDGAGRRAAAKILAIGPETRLAVDTPETIAQKPPFVRALVPLIKGDRMDTCLEKLVEVGVDAIIVWPATRSVVRLEPERADARLAKYHAAVQAAARQSGRAQIPSVRIVDELGIALSTLPDGARFVLDPTADAALEPDDASDITIASGPEGGFTMAELAAFEAARFRSIGLGPRILRAETAPIVAVSVIRVVTRS